MKIPAKKIKRNLPASTIYPYRNTEIGNGTRIHPSSIVGFPNRDPTFFSKKSERIVHFGRNCVVYPWSLIYEGASIGAGVEIHERCTVGSCTTIGDKTMILYGAQVHDNVSIGKRCIVAGFIADNCIVGDGSSVFGALIHRYKNPGRDRWDETDEPGPVLGKNVVVAWGAVIIGRVRIGDGAWISPNEVITEDVPAGANYATD